MISAFPLLELEALRSAGADRVDAVGWHYIETLAQRAQEQSGLVQSLLLVKLQDRLARFHERMKTATEPPSGSAVRPVVPSPMATLLQDMLSSGDPQGASKTVGRLAENPRVWQFRKQLSQISVQKQVTQAIAQAPQNAGPINSHMLVLRSLGLMRNISPDYLNRFMGYVDTLLLLDSPATVKTTTKKSVSASKSKR